MYVQNDVFLLYDVVVVYEIFRIYTYDSFDAREAALEKCLNILGRVVRKGRFLRSASTREIENLEESASIASG